MQWQIPKIWTDSTCYILGGGPSLNNVPIDRLKNRRVIAVNNAYKLGKFDFVYFMDNKWFTQHKETLRDYAGVPVSTALHTREVPWVKYLQFRHQGREGLDEKPGFLARGNSSGYGALTLAIGLGARRIILLGYDMKVINGKHNWHDDHMRKNISPDIYKNQFLKPFQSLPPLLNERNITVLNATPGSALRCFPFVDPEEVL